MIDSIDKNTARTLKKVINSGIFNLITSTPITSVSVNNMMGQEIRKYNFKDLLTERTLDSESLETGVYFLSVTTHRGTFIERLVIR
ncbi:MAG: T9SS type A sorting domain-containing protein [Saprospiraceae bacterium]|nr:T9SS type A sorting domain-containing protein [Saprospiraceae bacterium]